MITKWKNMAWGMAVIVWIVGTVAAEEDVRGVVVKVFDGDTIAIIEEENWEEVCVRLQAIDAPDKGQPGYREAQLFLAKLLHGQAVRVVVEKQDRYLRKVGRVYSGKMDVEFQLIRAGMAWHYTFFNQEKKLAEAQKAAQEEKIGIWKDPNPVQPYLWRKAKRNKNVKTTSSPTPSLPAP